MHNIETVKELVEAIDDNENVDFDRSELVCVDFC